MSNLPLPPAPNAAAKWIWDSQAALDKPPRISRVVFKREFTLAAAPDKAVLNLSASIEYRLAVNGQIVAVGPCRAYTDFWEYDTHDLAPLLKPGVNVVEVEVRHHTVVTFHTLCMDPGFIAWGEVGSTSLATPGEWTCRRRSGVDTTAPRISFAQEPVEFIDLRKDAGDAWGKPVVTADKNVCAPLRPRNIPLLTRIPVSPVAIKVAKGESEGLVMHGNREADYADGMEALTGAPRKKVPTRFALRIHSPFAQTVTAGVWWGEFTLNGREIKPQGDPANPLRQWLDLALNAGWNDFVMTQNMAFGYAENCIALPTDRGLKVEGERPREPQADLSKTPVSPLRHIAWTTAKNPKAVALGSEIGIPAGEKMLVTVDFGGITLAMPRIEIDAPAGTVIDIGHAEEGMSDGRPFIGKACVMYSADRFIAPGGETSIEFFGPRGFRYLDILVSGHSAPVRIRSISAFERRYPLAITGSFECSDTDFNNLWKWSKRTLELCSEDIFTDCPWRERTLYGGDMLSETGANAVFSRDLGCAKRSVEIFLQSASDLDGWLHSNAPRPRDAATLVDYALLTSIACGWYLRMTPDKPFAQRAWPAFKRMAETVEKWRRPDGVYGPPAPMWSFIDHNRKIRTGATCGFNAALRASFREWAVCADVIGETAEAAKMRAAGDALDAAMTPVFYDPVAKLYRDLPLADGAPVTEGTPANSWALLFCEGPRAKTPEILAALMEIMKKFSPKTESESVSPYQMFYFLSALRVAGNEATAFAEESIKRVYGLMLKDPTGTIWESGRGGDSMNHAWSCGVAVWLATTTLGIGFGLTDPEELKKIIVRPRSATLAWARGKIPHPLGMVEVEWTRKPDGTLDVKVNAPKGVEVVVA